MLKKTALFFAMCFIRQNLLLYGMTNGIHARLSLYIRFTFYLFKFLAIGFFYG